jgi:hypothetical protein
MTFAEWVGSWWRDDYNVHMLFDADAHPNVYKVFLGTTSALLRMV